MIAVPAVPPAPALVRVHESPAPVRVGLGRAAAERYVRSRFHLPYVDADQWRPRFVLNWVIGRRGASGRRTAFFARGRYLGSDSDSAWIGKIGRLETRTSTKATFALTLFRTQDPRCCPQGRTIRVRFHWNGKRLIQTRRLLRQGIELSEGLQMPSRNIGCIFSRSPRSMRCDVRSGLRPPPPRPRGCDLDWAYALEMAPMSRPKVLCAGDTVLGQGPILPYGATLRIEGFTCLSQRVGLRCTNRARHGFLLSRERWRRF
jgi:hypothetical protein